MSKEEQILYPNVFSRGKNIKTPESIFHQMTGLDLKEFLYEKYIVEGLASPQIAPMFGCTPSTILKKIKDFGFARDNSAARLHALGQRERIGDYDKVPSDIEAETGRPFLDIVNELLLEGFAPSEISRKLGLRSQTHIRKLLKEQEHNNQMVLFPEIFKNRRRLKESERLFFEKTGMTLRDFLNEKYVIEGRSTHAIAPLFGVSASTIHEKLKTYGISRNLSEARRKLVETGDIEYKEIMRKVRKTIRKSFGASNSQEFARKIFKEAIEKQLIRDDISDIEVIVGYNEWSILRNKEVDLPIVIFDLKSNNVYKIAIEYNGEYFHENLQRDKEKEQDLAIQKWETYAIYEFSNMSNARIEEEVSKLAEEIINKCLLYRETLH